MCIIVIDTSHQDLVFHSTDTHHAILLAGSIQFANPDRKGDALCSREGSGAMRQEKCMFS